MNISLMSSSLLFQQSHIPGSSNLDSFRDGWLVSVQLLLYRLLPPGLVQFSSQHSCVIAVKLFLHTLG